jgi:renalase
MTDIAIIGAGLSALTAANILKADANICIYEKSKGVSGRMSTRRAGPYEFDHGAQYFKAKSLAFENFISPLIAQGVIGRWDARFAEIEKSEIINQLNWDEGSPHYVGIPGMSAIGEYLSRGLTVNFNTRIGSLKKSRDKWYLIDDSGNEVGGYDWVVSALPAQQAIDLLPKSLIFYQEIRSVKMKACFALMLGFGEYIPLDFDAANVIGEDIGWISINSSKPKRNNSFCLLVHSSNKWADEHIDDNHNQVMEYLCEEASRIIGYDLTKPAHKDIHGWRYANVEKQEGQSHFIDQDQKVAACGDWCIQGGVESAFSSGLSLADQLLVTMENEKKHGA